MSEVEEKHFRIKKHINQKLICHEYLFFNIMLHKFNWKLDDSCPEGALGYVKFKNRDVNELDDGTIYINSKVITDPNFTHQNYFMILLHEFMHITFGHGIRQKDRDPMVWNLAADHVVNSIIKRTFKPSDVFPFGGWESCVLFNEKEISKPKVTTEEVYDYLVRNNVNGCRFTVTSMQYNGKGLKSYTIRDNKTGKEYVIDISENNTKEVENFNRIAGDIFQQIKERGDLSGDLAAVFDKFYKVEIPWTDILKEAIHKCLTPVPNSRGWKTLNKLFIPHGYTLPGITYDFEPNTDTAIVSIDTSGSISNKELNDFANVLVDSIIHFKKIILITHDHTIHQVEEFFKHDQQKLIKFISEVGFKGRGGTSHKEVFDKIQEIDNDISEGLSIYISLTDGYSDIDECWKDNEWSKKNTVPTYFIITKDGQTPKVCSSEYDRVKSIRINS